MTDVTLRPADLADFEALQRLYKDLVGTIEVPDGDAGRARMAQVLDHPGTTVFVADLLGQPVSMATLHVLPNMTFGGRPYALVENVVTLRAHHGLGLGRRVMEHLAEAAWAAGAYKIMLLTGKDLGARGFYEKLGYTADEKFGMTLRRAPKRQPL
ncbi:GNAT family N-acetyltransferase [Falsiphaeobacter marinintestinus]|uniref:GNAT family N-acetyltransferase n=1 Tax=Falsiphaeobacter marinintestinus TaxID=1492905 RepID=UPI0011B3E850|nr:GNAT family N-acetyltransferase [Phaeobacter marinintestinus]